MFGLQEDTGIRAGGSRGLVGMPNHSESLLGWCRISLEASGPGGAEVARLPGQSLLGQPWADLPAFLSKTPFLSLHC